MPLPVPLFGDTLLLGVVFGEVPGLKLLGVVFGEVPGLKLLGVVFGEVPGLKLLGLLGLVFGEVPGLKLLGLVFGEVPGLKLLGLVFGEVPGFRLLGLVFGEVPGFRLLGLLGLVFGAVPGLALLGLLGFGEVPGLALLGLLGFAVPAGVVIGAPAASLVTLLGFRGSLGLPAALGFGGAGGLPGAGAVFLGAALVPHKLTKSKVVPPGVSMKQTGTFTRGFEALGNWDVPGMGRLKAASAISGIKAADKAAIVRNILISVSSNIELCLLQYCPEITKCLHPKSRSYYVAAGCNISQTQKVHLEKAESATVVSCDKII